MLANATAAIYTRESQSSPYHVEVQIVSLILPLEPVKKISESLCCAMPFVAYNGTFVETGLFSGLSKTAVFGLFKRGKHSETLILTGS